ncbi:MAG: sensor histidine kinase [Caulobacteraceae bacterium]
MGVRSGAPAPGTFFWWFALLFPVALWLAGCFAVSLAAEAWICRWVEYVERIARAYGKGRYTVRPQRTADAPGEFRDLGEVVGEMGAAIEERDRDLRAAVEAQTMLMREVHHRVKNNLQIVSSLLGLQLSNNKSPEAREALLAALVRLETVSLSEKFTGEHDRRDVSLPKLFEAWAIQLKNRLDPDGQRIDLSLDIEDRRVPLDIATPMALIATEAVLKVRGAQGDAAAVAIRLKIHGEGERLLFTLDADRQVLTDPPDLSLSLIHGYARQVRGRLDLKSGPGRISLEAPMSIAA